MGGFSEELWDSFEVVYKKVTDGKKFSEEISVLFKKLAEIERDYSKKLATALKSANSALAPETIESGSVLEAWQVIKRETENTAKKHNDFADALISGVSEPLAAWNKENSKARHKLKADGTKLVKDMIAGEQKVNKAKQAFEVAKRTLETTERSLKRDTKKLAVDSKRAEQADSQYLEAVNSQKEIELKFYDTEMPKILNDLEALEVSRRNTVKAGFTRYVELQVKLSIDPSQIQAMQNAVANIEASEDIKRFIQEVQTRKEKPPRTEYEPYNPAIKACAPAQSHLNPQTSQAVLSSASYNPPATHYTPPPLSASNSGGVSPYGSATLPSYGSASAMVPTNERTVVAPGGYDVPAPQNKARALYDYASSDPKELSFAKGDLINILGKDASGWWQGELNGAHGLFPSNFVEEIVVTAPPRPAKPKGVATPGGLGIPSPFVSAHSAASVATQSSYVSPQAPNASYNAAGGSYESRQPTLNPSPQPVAQSQPSAKQCRVLYNYDAENEYELTIRTGEVLLIGQLDDDGWYRGTNANGQYGRFPSNFVETL
eukprot:TRINITY_DN1645_c0_g1_i4.p1 TRINITY_DN1645_c0_g1~~TRINITY_DN1645_c0_g1_i4.p1  ORF type:complete len:547 (+),score=112.75 TRINITY_DN1645_c0_g1_i4:170-1810(+)